MSTWQAPVTDRTTGAIHTLQDQNRIAGNLDYLATELTALQLYSGATVQKTTYIYNDYISVDDWTDILGVLDSILSSLALDGAGSANDSMTYENMNTVEDLMLQIYERLQLLLDQANANHYAGDNIFTEGAGSIYAGGLLI